MDKIRIPDGRTQDKVRDLCTKIYNLRPSDYDITSFANESIVTFNCPDKAAPSKIIIELGNGGYAGYLYCYPSLNGGKMHSLEEIIKHVADEGVTVNVNEKAIQEAYESFSEGTVVEKVLIAEGIPAIQGKDAEIVVLFGKKDNRPKIVDGKIDYKNLDNITMVSKGDVLITKKPASAGVRGMNIKHEETIPIPGKDVTILPGDGATVNDAGTVFTAMVDGYVEYGNKRLSVNPVYIVKGDVDYSTGNIKFNGAVHVKGDVLSGFRVEASKSILVDGICQDCELVARGNVILRTGMKGTGNGFINAGGTVILGYCEKSKVYAKENIEIKKYAFNSELFAGNRVDATSGDGVIAGGVVRAFQEITVKQLGTQGNMKFTTIVGNKYYIEFELERLRAEKQRVMGTMAKIGEVLSKFDLTREKIVSHPKIRKMLEAQSSLLSLQSDLEKREEKLIIENKARNPRIKVKGRVFEGVTVMFYNVGSVIKEQMENIIFYYDEKYREVAWVSMKNANSIDVHDK